MNGETPYWIAPAMTTGLDTTLGLKVTEVLPDLVIVRCELGPQHLQPFGIVHGGLYATLVESAASIAANNWLGPPRSAAGISNQTDLYRSISAGTVTAVATPVHRGRQQQVWQVNISSVDGKLLARGQLRLLNDGDPHLKEAGQQPPTESRP